MLPKMSGYVTCFDEIKYISFLIEDEEWLKTYNKVKFKTKIISYGDKINADFHNNGAPKESSHCVCLSAILICYIFKMGKSIILQVFLKKCQ